VVFKNEKLCDLYSLCNIVLAVKSRILWQSGHTDTMRMRGMHTEFYFFVYHVALNNTSLF
jgi:hypothetical protein